MKKFLTVCFVMVGLFIVAGCEKVEETGKYKEGTYFGSYQYDSYGTQYVTTAVIYVNNGGVIKSVYLDSTYNKDGVNTTKKTLGDAYGMKETSASMGNIPGGAEWYEQAKSIEEKVVSEQGLDWVKWSDDAKTKLDVDTISGVTISADSYIKAIDSALSQAK